MNQLKLILSLTFLFLFFVTACNLNSSEQDEMFTSSDTKIIKGKADSVFINVINDGMYSHSFNIKYIELVEKESHHNLNIDVAYGGGNGCPSSTFVLQRDNNISDSDTLELWLAHFNPNEVICEALVEETLEFNADSLLGDVDANNFTYKVYNYYDSTATSYDPKSNN